MLRTFKDTPSPRVYMATPQVAPAPKDSATAWGTLVQPGTGGPHGARAITDDALMPADNTAPLGSAKRRGARPLDVAVLGGLAGGPVGADILAAPWAVGLGPSGALADPTRSARPMVASHSAGHALLHERGLPVFVEGHGEGWQLAYQTASGIPWGLGHWPFLPRVGVGGQFKNYTSHLSTVCVKLPEPVARRVAQRMATWWWPTLHRVGADVGPFKLPLPAAMPDQPLRWLQPGDSADVTVCKHRFLSAGLVFGWLRMGPQWAGQSGATLRLERDVQQQASMDVTLEFFDTTRRVPMMFDLPALALLSIDGNTQKVHRFHWQLQMDSAAGKLTYQLVADSFKRVEAPPTLPASTHTPGSVHMAHSDGVEATVFLPWTFLQRHVRGAGVMREWGTASVVHEGSGRRGRSLWVEGETETVFGGHDGYRIGLHGGLPQGPCAMPQTVHVDIKLHIERLQGARLTQLMTLLTDGFGARPKALRVGSNSSGEGGAVDARVQLHFEVDTAQLWGAKRLFVPPHLREAAKKLGVDVAALGELARGMAEGLQEMVHSHDPLKALDMRALLRRHGPQTMALLGHWLAPPESRTLEVHYGETAQLVADVLAQAARGPGPGSRAQGPEPRAGERLWGRAHSVGLWAQLGALQARLEQDPLLALCAPSLIAEQIAELRFAAQRLCQAVPRTLGARNM